MKFVARVVATVILGSLLFTQAFAEDSANSSNSTTTEPGAQTLLAALPLIWRHSSQRKPQPRQPRPKLTAMATLILRSISLPAIPSYASALILVASKRHSTGTVLLELWPATLIAGSALSVILAFIALRMSHAPSVAARILIFSARNSPTVVSAGRLSSTPCSALPASRIYKLPPFRRVRLFSIDHFPRTHLPRLLASGSTETLTSTSAFACSRSNI